MPQPSRYNTTFPGVIKRIHRAHREASEVVAPELHLSSLPLPNPPRMQGQEGSLM
jgi:hypothetical protein